MTIFQVEFLREKGRKKGRREGGRKKRKKRGRKKRRGRGEKSEAALVNTGSERTN